MLMGALTERMKSMYPRMCYSSASREDLFLGHCRIPRVAGSEAKEVGQGCLGPGWEK